MLPPSNSDISERLVSNTGATVFIDECCCVPAFQIGNAFERHPHRVALGLQAGDFGAQLDLVEG